MTMVSTGPISLGGNATSGGLNQSVNIELGRSATASINMNESAVRTLAGVSSGAISMSNFYGKSNQFAFTISSNQTNAALSTLAINAGWNQNSRLVATIAGGVIISSNGTGIPALLISGSFPGGVELINNGVIVGMGGNGGNAGNGLYNTQATAGSAGGTAISVSSAVSINNAGTIAGGGGGGGGGGAWSAGKQWTLGGGGGGGRSSNAANSSGGAGSFTPFGGTSPGQPGGAGTYSSAGAGGARGNSGGQFWGGNGGNGGDWGSAGATGQTSQIPYGTNNIPAQAGGSGGAAVSGNSNVTWIATGTRFGALT